jgi:hypothetical protein
LPCDPQKAGEGECLDQFLDGFARRAWRRPLEAGERDNLKRAFTEGRTASFADGIGSVIQVLLLSPQFMYRFERGVPVPGTSYAKLTSWELASRLSYLLVELDARRSAAGRRRERDHLGHAAEVLEQARPDDRRSARGRHPGRLQRPVAAPRGAGRPRTRRRWSSPASRTSCASRCAWRPRS